MVKIAHLDAQNRVINISIGDGAPEPDATDAAGHALVLAGNAAIGDDYLEGEFYTPPPPPLTEAEIIEAAQKHLDAVAVARGYDSILAACTYATSTNPTFAAEGSACVIWRDEVWESVFSVIAEVAAATRSAPTEEQLLGGLPAIVWPQ